MSDLNDPDRPGPVVYDRAIEAGKTPKEAEEKLLESIFGVGFQRDAKGRPIEVGKGSAKQQTSQHKMAIEKAEGRK